MVLSSAGMAANTPLALETNLVRRKFPFFNNCINYSDDLIARSVVGTENKQSSTKKFLDTTSRTSLLKSALLSEAVVWHLKR